MTREQTINKLKDPTLAAHERESLLQYLHYLTVENPKPKTKPKTKRTPKR